ncbi:hypothetical protein [Amycolatopsis sp. cg9]|uniref:hypothetical protein n=1 Tax=Amycolatopsis sp. cg9 TaxID=3238801 RepID=UPI0035253725
MPTPRVIAGRPARDVRGVSGCSIAKSGIADNFFGSAYSVPEARFDSVNRQLLAIAHDMRDTALCVQISVAEDFLLIRRNLAVRQQPSAGQPGYCRRIEKRIRARNRGPS